MISNDKIIMSYADSDETGHLNKKTFMGNASVTDPISIEVPKSIQLSKRQAQMLDAIVKGLRYKEIAFEYDISENTVAFHISKLKQRLNCVSSREIISKAIIHGLIKVEKK